MAIGTAPRRLYGTFRVLIHEITRFGLVGIGAFAVDVGLFNLLHFGPPHIGPVTSKAISTVLAATVSYFANRHWTFRHRARTSLAREYRLFLLLSAVGLGISEACLAFSHYALGLHSVLADNVSANGFGLAFGMIFRFWSFKRWVFLAPPSESVPVAPAEAMLRTSV